MNSSLTTCIYTAGDELPAMSCRNYFHSAALFDLCTKASRQRPYMVVVQAPDGHIVAHLLCMLRFRSSWFPPYLYAHCRIMGEGEYEASPYPADQLFGLMLQALTEKLQRWVLYIEVSDLSTKMFGYRQFRENKFFSIHWMSIHNSLHSRTPEERIGDNMKRRIANGHERGVETKPVETEAELKSFMRLLKQHNILKPKRYIPDENFFRGFIGNDNGQLFITRYHQKVVGCCACAYSNDNAYLWYSAFRRKSYAWLHPDVMTIWHAIKNADARHCQHICFMDVGLPFRRNPFREFILSFGGKPVSTYRWFRCNIGWVNRLLSWIYRD